MKKSIKILLTMLLTIILSGCIIKAPSNEDYIDIEKLYNENKEVIDLEIANMDLKGYADKETFKAKVIEEDITYITDYVKEKDIERELNKTSKYK